MTHNLIITISKGLEPALNKVMKTREYDGVVPAGRWAELFGFKPLQVGNLFAYMAGIQALTKEDCTRSVEWFQDMYQKGEFVWDEIHRLLDAASPENREKFRQGDFFDLPGIRSKLKKGFLSEQDHPFVKQPCIRYPGTDKDLYQKSWFFGVDPVLLDSNGILTSKYSNGIDQDKALYDQLWDRILNVRKGMYIFILDGHY